MKLHQAWLSYVVLATVLGDQLVKQAIVRRIRLGGSIVTPLHVLTLEHHHNPVAVYGSLAYMDNAYRVPLLVLLPALVLLALVWVARQLDESEGKLLLALGLIGGGAVGNLVDRVLRGYVVDFMRFSWGTSHSAVYNLADLFIFAGFALLCIRVFTVSRPLRVA